jgi:hypothetical protein
MKPSRLTGPTTWQGASLEQAYFDHQMDKSPSGDRSCLTAEVDWFYQTLLQKQRYTMPFH